MVSHAKLLAAAALTVALTTGCQVLSGGGGGGSQPTAAPSSSGPVVARGTFMSHGAKVELEATGGGSDVTGRLIVAAESAGFTVDLECTRSTDDGLVWVGGDVTESTMLEYAPKGTRAGIILKRGSPVEAEFVFQMTDPRSSSCLAFFDDMLALAPVRDFEPIEGTVELAP